MKIISYKPKTVSAKKSLHSMAKKPVKKLASTLAKSGLSEFDRIFDNFRKDMEKSFSSFLRMDFSSFPKLHETDCDVIDESNHIRMKMNMQDLKKNEINLNVTDNSIEVTGEHKEEEKKKNFLRKKRHSISFRRNAFMLSRDKTLIIVAIVVGVVALAGIIGFIGQGNVRHVSIFWQEHVEQTVAFKDVDGKVQLQGISEIGGEPNPHLITRTSFAYILTVINNGDKHHRLYIEGLNVQTNLLEPGEQETLIIYPEKEGVYKYFDKRENSEYLGFLEVKTVVHSDEFTGIWRDLI